MAKQTIRLLPPRMSAAVGSGLVILFGCTGIYFKSKELWDHARLEKSGRPTSGTLQMVTKHYYNFIPSGYSFTIQYAGRSRSFEATKKLFLENTLPDGRFTQHDIPLIYLPDEPDVAELPGVSASAPFVSFMVLSLLTCAGCLGMYRVLAKKPSRNQGGRHTMPPKGVERPKVRSFVVDEHGGIHVSDN